MSLVKSAFVLLSALLSQSCTQALPSPHEWINIPEKPFVDVAPLNPPIDRSSPKSDFLAGKVLVSASTFDESNAYNRQYSTIPERYFKAPRKHHNFQHFPKVYYHEGPRYLGRHGSSIKTNPFERYMREFSNTRSGMGLPGSLIARGAFSGPGNFVGDLYLTQPDTPRTHQSGNKFKTSGERYITREELFLELRTIEMALKQLNSAVLFMAEWCNSDTFTTSPQPPVLIDPSVSSDLKPTEPSVEGVTSPTVTTSPQTPVLSDPSVSSDLKPTEPSVEGVTSPTVTTSPQTPVLSDRSGVSELGPIEANNEEEVAYPTEASSAQPPAPIDSSEAFKLGPMEANNEEEGTNPILTTPMELPNFNYPEGYNGLQVPIEY